MARIGTTFWYGSFHHEEETGKPHLLPGLAWTAVIALLVACRFNLPFHVVDPAEIHTTILNSLVIGQTWGRQALVGSAEFPLLTTVSLLFARTLGEWIRLPAIHVLVVTAQIWTFIYLLRMPRNAAGRALVFCLVLGLFVSPLFRSVVFALDPNWIAGVPAAAALYHMVKWHRHHALRDTVLLAVNCGMLAFAGPAGAVTGFILLATCALHLRQLKNADPATDTRGIPFLLWMPFVYCIALLLLANWLILRDAFFIIDRVVSALAAQSLSELGIKTVVSVTTLPWLVPGAVVVTALFAARKRRVIPGILFAVLISISLCFAVLDAAGLHIPGGYILMLVIALAGLVPPAFAADAERLDLRNAASALVIIAVTVLLMVIFPHKNYEEHVNVIGKHPHRRDITAWVDDSWSKARIMVYGVKAPSIYVDLKEKRFVARIDYSDDAFLWRARDEQIYLLVPPQDGRYYSAAHSAMAAIHQQGKPWLLLEKQWAPGWQLWRSVVLPASEK